LPGQWPARRRHRMALVRARRGNPGWKRVSEEAQPRCGTTLVGVKRRQETRVPRARPVPDGHQSGGTPSTDSSVINRRVFLAPALPMTQNHGVRHGVRRCQTFGSHLLTAEVIAIGIGGGLTTSPLPHQRTDGSRRRRCGGVRGGVNLRTGWGGRAPRRRAVAARAPARGSASAATGRGRTYPCSRPTAGPRRVVAAPERRSGPRACRGRSGAAAGSTGPGRAAARGPRPSRSTRASLASAGAGPPRAVGWSAPACGP
jgi:hypothetical protein